MTLIRADHDHPRRDWHEMLAAPGIANQHGAVLSGLEDAHALLCELGDVMHA
ncbi:MAG: hypothetical protein KJ729_01775 [Euryarchaeota archaeon]|nr:hypothetical protein [Euryarchaeota archaeon]